MIFLTRNLRSQSAKRFILLLGFVFLFLFVQAQTGVVNNGARMVVSTGAIIKITGTGADYTNATSGGEDGRIDLDGKIELQGDWTNNAVSGDVLIALNTDGEVVFNGASSQSISGSRASFFEKMTLNNVTGLNLTANSNIEGILSLTNGNITLNSSDLTIGLLGSITGGTFSTSKMIVVNGTGSLVKSINAAGSFTFPIGESTSVVEYSPVDFTLNGHGGASNSWVSAHVTDTQHPSDNSPSEFLSRYWTLSSSGMTSPDYDADFHYLPADINGVELSIYAAEYDDASNRNVHNAVNDALNIVSVTGLSTIDNTFADYTGVDGTIPTVVITCGVSDPTNNDPIPFTATFSEAVSGFAYTDITIDNGTTLAVSTTDDIEYTFNVEPTTDGDVTIDINAGVCTDIAGNDNAAANQFSILYDGTDPNVNLTTTASNPTNLSPFTVKVQFTEKVNGFVVGDVSVTNGTADNLVVVATDSVWTVEITPGIDGDVTVDINAGVADDAAGNLNIAGQIIVDYDGTDPTVNITSVESTLTNAKPFEITITFDEVVTGFALADITVGNGSAGDLVNTIEGEVWTANITPGVNGTVTVDINVGVALDAATNGNEAATQFSITYDGTSPTVDITSGETDPTNGSFIVSIYFSEPVTGFDVGDVNVGNGTKGTFTPNGNDQDWTLQINPITSGLLVTVDIAADVATDAASNGNAIAIQYSITYDNVNPTATYTPADGATDVSITSNLDINFSEVVNAVSGNIKLYETTGDVLVETFDVLTEISGDGTSTITINPASDLSSATLYYVQIDVAAFADDAGNSFAGMLITDKTTWNFTSADVNNPYISSTSPADNAIDVVINENLVITFSEIVDAESGNIELYENGVGTPIETFDVTTDITGSGSPTITINPALDLDGEKDYYVLIDATAFDDVTSNSFAGISNTAEWNFTTEDVAAPTVDVLSPTDNAPNVAINSDLVITFNENVFIGTGNITITDASGSPVHETIAVGSVSITDNVATINPSLDFNGETAYYVEIDATAFKDASDNYYAGITGSSDWNFTSEDVASPTVVVSTTESSPTNTSPFEITITFNEEVQNFTAGDISVTNGSADNLDATGNPVFTADITPVSEGNVVIIITAGAAEDLAGNGNEESNEITLVYDITSPTVEITSTQSGTINTDLDLTITFNEEITDLVIGNITVVNGTVSNLTNTTPGTIWDATITPTADGTVTVDILIDEVIDLAGNGNTASNQFTIDYDGSAPIVDVLSPTDDAIDVVVSENLQITFDEEVNQGAGFIEIYKTTGDVFVEQISVAVLTGYGTKIITIDPASDFESEVEYYVLIDAGAFTDLVGNDYAGISVTTDWSFTSADISEPTVDLLSPTDDEVDVLINSNLVITFSENVLANVGNITIMDTDEALAYEVIDVTSGQVVIASDVVTITPSIAFIGQTHYHVIVNQSSFKDVAGNNFGGITGDTEWNFFTEDKNASVITALSPPDNSSGVSVATNFEITFDENIVANTGNITIMNETTSSVHEEIAIGSANITISNNTVAIDPTNNLTGLNNYYILIDAGTLKDDLENLYGGITNVNEWNFITADASAPSIISKTPADNASDVSVSSDLEIEFNETVYANTGDITIMNATTSTIHETIDVTSGLVTINSEFVTINPTVDFVGETDYYVLVDSAAFEDAETNAHGGILGTASWNFTTIDITDPLANSFSPLDGAIDVSIIANLEITFNEDVVADNGDIIIWNATLGAIHETINVTSGEISFAGNVLTINLSSDFIGSNDYYVLIDATAIRDLSGNNYAGFSNVTDWNFTTVDMTNPVVTSLSPSNGANNVVVTSDLVMTFSETVEANTGNITIYNATTSANHEVFDISSTQVTIATNVVTINPTSDLDGLSNYYVLIADGALQDIDANNYAGMVSSSDWNFTTVDASAPVVNSYTPIDGAIDVLITSDLVMTFDETVVANTGSITIMNATTSTTHEVIDVTSGLVTISSAVVTINPSIDFVGDADYYVLVDNGAFRDTEAIDFGGIADPSKWNFSTEDKTLPTLVSRIPVDNATDVLINSNLVITFDENIFINTGNITIYDSNTDSIYEQITVPSGLVTTATNTVTIDPSTDFVENTAYYVLIAADVFMDANGNGFAGIAGITTWNFVVADITLPTIITLSPIDDATGVSVSSDLQITFSENVIANTGLINIMTVDSTCWSSIDVSSTNIVDNVVTINPDINFSELTDYSVLIDVGAFHDESGNSFAGISDTTSWNFTTGDITQPSVVITSSEAGTITGNFDITVTFSEPVIGFISDDITVTNGTVGTFTESTPGLIWTATIQPTTDGDVTVNIVAGVAQDAGGNDNTAAVTYTILYDATAPTVLITPTAKSVNVTGNFDVTVTFSELVTGFTIDDITVGNATLGTFIESTAGLIWTVTIQPTVDGDVTIDLAAGVVTDIAGNANIAAATYTVGYDATAPTVAITSSATGTVTGNFDVTVTFSELVTGFTIDDITVSNATLGTLTESTVGLIWTVTIEPIANGDVTIDIDAGAVTDIAGNENTAATQFSIVYDDEVGFEDMIPYEISIYSIESRVIIEFTNEGNYQFKEGVIEIYNLLGQRIVTNTIDDFVKFETELDHVSQIYVVKVVIDGNPYTKRLYIK